MIQPWEYDRIPAYRAANPGIRILMYKDVSATVDKPHGTGLYPTGLSYSSADQHPGGSSPTPSATAGWADYPGLLPMDVGDTGYQDAWADDVLTELQTHDWDGVMLDDTLTSLSHPTVGGLTSTQIPDDESMREATESFLSRVGPRLEGRGPRDPQPHGRPRRVGLRGPGLEPLRQRLGDRVLRQWGTRRARFEGDLWRSRLDMALLVRRPPRAAAGRHLRQRGGHRDAEVPPGHLAARLGRDDRRGVFVPEQPDAGLAGPRQHRHRSARQPRTRLANGVYLRPLQRRHRRREPTSARGPSTSAAPTNGSATSRSPRSGSPPQRPSCCAGCADAIPDGADHEFRESPDRTAGRVILRPWNRPAARGDRPPRATRRRHSSRTHRALILQLPRRVRAAARPHPRPAPAWFALDWGDLDHARHQPPATTW